MMGTAHLPGNCTALLEKERLLFEEEYRKNYLAEESKSPKIGEP